MSLEGEPQAVGFADKVIAGSWVNKIFFGDKIIAGDKALVGAVPLRDGTVIVTKDTVHYYGLDHELIETLDELSLPISNIVQAGRTDDLLLVLRGKAGMFIADSELLEFTEVELPKDIKWSKFVEASEEEQEIWKIAYAGEGLSLYRIILDVHSGRFFGPVGKWIYDITAIGTILLSATGMYLFFRHRKRSV